MKSDKIISMELTPFSSNFDKMPSTQIKKSASTEVHSKTKFAISWDPSFVPRSNKMHLIEPSSFPEGAT